jgi:starvation-inducible outer membrane lipoprotein
MRTKRIGLVALVLALMLAACSAHPRKVDCEGHLTPINAPAPAVPMGSPHP